MKTTILKALRTYVRECINGMAKAKNIDEAQFWEAEKLKAESIYRQIAKTETGDLIF